MAVYILAAFAAVFVFIVLLSMKKSGHFFKSLTLSAVMGTASLLAVNASGVLTGVSVNVNALSIASGIVFGTPGIIFHLIASLIIK